MPGVCTRRQGSVSHKDWRLSVLHEGDKSTLWKNSWSNCLRKKSQWEAQAPFQSLPWASFGSFSKFWALCLRAKCGVCSCVSVSFIKEKDRILLRALSVMSDTNSDWIDLRKKIFMELKWSGAGFRHNWIQEIKSCHQDLIFLRHWLCLPFQSTPGSSRFTSSHSSSNRNPGYFFPTVSQN